MTTLSSTNVSSKEAVLRQQCLDSFDEFINKCQSDITAMLDTLGWTPEHFMKPKNVVVCPHNKDHNMPKSSLVEHQSVCALVAQGYSKDEAEKILEDTSYFYENASCVYSVKLDLSTLNSVLWNHHVQNHSVFYGYKKVPQTPEEEQQLMSREDRLGVSEYIIKRAKEANRLKELGQDELLVSENLADLIKKDTEERKLDPIEEMAALRDYRRRRQTYRAKNVHITKKSHTEIMREVINNQMEMYTQTVKEELGLLTPERTEDKLTDDRDRSSRYSHEDRYQHREHRSRDTTSRRLRSRDTTSRRSRSRDTTSRRSKGRDTTSRRSRSRDTTSRRSRSRDRTSRRSRSRDITSRRSRSRDTNSRRSKSRDPTSRRSRSRDTTSRRSRSRDTTSRRSRSRDTTSRSETGTKNQSETRNQFTRDDQVENENRTSSGALSVRDNPSVPDNPCVADEQSSNRSRSRSEDRGRTKHKKKDKHRSRSRSTSRDRSKKHKKHKHKHKKHKKSSREGGGGGSENEKRGGGSDTEAGGGADHERGGGGDSSNEEGEI